MSNARDKANIPALNFSSTGIDDNATSTAITIDSSQNVDVAGNIKFADNGRAVFGAGSDLQIWHTGSHSYIMDSGTGNLYLQGSSNIRFQNPNNVTLMNIADNGDITFYEDTGTTPKFFWDASTERLGIGTSSPSYNFHIVGNASSTVSGRIQNTNSGGLAFFGARNSDGSGCNYGVGGTGYTAISLFTNRGFISAQSTTDGLVLNTEDTDPIIFGISNSEKMRIDSSGRLLINTTAPIQESVEKLGVTGGISTFNRDSGVPVVINRGNNDGELINFRQNGTQEGSISVSGSTVSYNGFTGTHWSRFTDNSTPTILKGTVLESLDEMCNWYNLEFDVTTTTQDEDGNDVETVRTKKIGHVLLDSQSVGDTVTYNYEGTDYQATIVKETDIKHMKSKVSDTVDAKNVYGVFKNYDEDGEGYNDFYVASVGSFVVRIKQGETVAKGDLLQSNGDGTAKVQTDDAVRSSSFAKVLSTTIIETYEDGSYLVPCSLIC